MDVKIFQKTSYDHDLNILADQKAWAKQKYLVIRQTLE